MLEGHLEGVARTCRLFMPYSTGSNGWMDVVLAVISAYLPLRPIR